MTTFQIVSALAFLGTLVAAYFPQIKQFANKFVPAKAPTVTTPNTPTQLVSDMVTVAELRDRLAQLGCKDGASACTVLLRVMVEFKYPQG